MAHGGACTVLWYRYPRPYVRIICLSYTLTGGFSFCLFFVMCTRHHSNDENINLQICIIALKNSHTLSRASIKASTIILYITNRQKTLPNLVFLLSLVGCIEQEFITRASHAHQGTIIIHKTIAENTSKSCSCCHW